MRNVKSQPKRNSLFEVDAFNEFIFNLIVLKSGTYRHFTDDTSMMGPLNNDASVTIHVRCAYVPIK